MDKSTRIIAKIKKLLAMADAESGASVQERETALRQATAMMDKHALSIDQVNADISSDPRGQSSLELGRGVWKPQVFSAVARLYGVVVYRYPSTGVLYLVGKESARITVGALAAWCIASIEREAVAKVESGGGRRTAFKKGAAIGIHTTVDRLLRERAQGLTTEPGTALVVVQTYENEHQANEDWLKATGARIRKGRAMTTGDRSAFAHGKAYGGSLGLNRQVGGGTVAKLK